MVRVFTVTFAFYFLVAHLARYEASSHVSVRDKKMCRRPNRRPIAVRRASFVSVYI